MLVLMVLLLHSEARIGNGKHSDDVLLPTAAAGERTSILEQADQTLQASGWDEKLPQRLERSAEALASGYT